MTLGERIKLRRKELGLTQVQLGEMVHKSSQVVSNWERGYTTAMSPEDLRNIAQALNVNIPALMDDPAPPAPQKSAAPPELNARDERDIERDLADMMHSVAMANYTAPGEKEDAEALEAALRFAMVQAKRMAKKKYTPRKYRKDER